MGVAFKPLDRRQQYLLPPSVDEWLPEGDLAYFLIDLVGQLDLSEFYRHYEVAIDPETGEERSKAASGQPAFHPKMMVALLLYGYANGETSSRRLPCYKAAPCSSASSVYGVLYGSASKNG